MGDLTGSNSRNLLAAVISAVSVFVAVAFVIWAMSSGLPRPGNHEDDKVVIEGDAELAGEGEVVSGDGSAEDPYVIAGLDLDFYSDPCVRLANISSHLVVKDSVISYHHQSWMGDIVTTGVGLLIQSCTNITLSNVTFDACDLIVEDCRLISVQDLDVTWHCLVKFSNCTASSITGGRIKQVELWNCSQCQIRGTVGTYEGRIYLAYCEDCLIEENSVTSYNGGIKLDYFALNCTISRNTLVNASWAIQLTGAVDCLVTENVIFSTGWDGDGVTVWSGTNVTIAGNEIAECGWQGISCWENASGCTIVGNNISACYVGIALRGASGCAVYHNNIFETNQSRALDENGDENEWDAGYPAGGNHYSNYSGEDLYGGPDQSVPGSDGIGDTPMPIYTYLPEGTAVDRYPLMTPYGGA